MAKPHPITEHVFESARHRTFYLACGPEDGPRLVFVHGWPELSISWRHQLLVGPNLADSLGAKMQKIFGRQLMLSQHPAAQIHLPQKVAKAQALVKGWLFYHSNFHHDGFHHQQASGTAAAHCHGFWCAVSELCKLQAQRYAILPRLSWLAPARILMEQTMTMQSLEKTLRAHFMQDRMPVMVALMAQDGDAMFEIERGFIVPDDWSQRAAEGVSLS